MGDSRKQLSKAILNIKKNIGTVIRQSKLYQTAAWGNTNQPDFLNQVIVVETKLPAPETMQTILNIEQSMGRVRSKKNAPRIIDIDILFFNKEVIHSKNLVVPHAAIQDRRFVLIPLNELAPRLKHPIHNKSVHELLKTCKDDLDVKKY